MLAVAAVAVAASACDTGDGTTLRPPETVVAGGPCRADATLFSDADGIFALRSPDLAVDGPIPARYGSLGAGSRWPALVWSLPPPEAVELALTLVDDQTDEVLWLVGGLDPGEDCIPEGELPDDADELSNDLGTAGYSPPALGPSEPARFYVFTLYALDASLDDLPANATTDDVLATIDDRTIATTLLVGTSATETMTGDG